jgi:uracil-DNA glycosylase
MTLMETPMPATSTELTWSTVLAEEKEKDYFKQILQFVKHEHLAGKQIYPPQKDIFNALKLTPFETIKVVILGQDPYHGAGQAHGLAFSVQPGIDIPPSLRNIFQELHSDLGMSKPKQGCLQKWAEQGVLLLNAVLTVESGKAHSHAHIGWQRFTDKVIESLNNHPEGIVFLLWGASAQSKAALIDNKKHLILTTTHPSPLSAHRGFMGCRHFSKANDWLKKIGRAPIDWSGLVE